GFNSLTNTRSIIAGTYRFHYHDEINGLPIITLSGDVSAEDTEIRFGSLVLPGSLIQIGREVMLAKGTDSGGSTTVVRGLHQTTAADHSGGTNVYVLKE